ncbi:MAG: sigma-70 family RNA polymerase sigma factor [Opitutales bacterium]
MKRNKMNLVKSTVSESINSGSIARVDSDIDIISRVKEGDMQAFDTLVNKYRERLFSVVYGITSNREDAMDITQDVFIKAFKSLAGFKNNSSFYTWIYRIAVNMSINFVKKNRFRRFFSFEKINEEIAPAEIIDALVEKKGARNSILLNELKEKLNEALQNLSIEHRTVVILHEVEGLSHSEIAEIVGTKEATVRSRLFYAKQQLQAMLKNYIK